jgi:hypothetical protein
VIASGAAEAGAAMMDVRIPAPDSSVRDSRASTWNRVCVFLRGVFMGIELVRLSVV